MIEGRDPTEIETVDGREKEEMEEMETSTEAGRLLDEIAQEIDTRSQRSSVMREKEDRSVDP